MVISAPPRRERPVTHMDCFPYRFTPTEHSMHRTSSQRLTAAFAAAAALYLAAPTPASAQARELKSWPAQGAWHTTLIERPNGAGYMCMLNGIGRDPHGFGISIIEMPGHLMF